MSFSLHQRSGRKHFIAGRDYSTRTKWATPMKARTCSIPRPLVIQIPATTTEQSSRLSRNEISSNTSKRCKRSCVGRDRQTDTFARVSATLFGNYLQHQRREHQGVRIFFRSREICESVISESLVDAPHRDEPWKINFNEGGRPLPHVLVRSNAEHVRARRANHKPIVRQQLRESRRAVGVAPGFAPRRNHMFAEALLHR